jgi:thiol-disulfide isomerase/thioredoxin
VKISSSSLIQPGRVEVLSFFFLGCAPCMRELSELNTLQDRYGKKKLVATAVTTYKSNSHLNPPTHSNIETSVKRTVAETAPGVAVVITTDETLATYGVNGFSVDRGQDGKSPLHGARDRF